MSALTDPVADFLTRLRNASRAHKKLVKLPHSRLKGEIARVLKQEGFLEDFSVQQEGAKRTLEVTIRFSGPTSAITNLRRVSRPGLRHFVNAGEIPRVRGGNGIALLSTSRGVMSGHEAKRQNVGGELLAVVY